MIHETAEIFNMVESDHTSDIPVLVLAGGEGSRLKNKGYTDLDKWPKLLLDVPYTDQEFKLERATMLDRTLLALRKSGYTNIRPLISNNNTLIRAHLLAFYGSDRTIPMELQLYEGRANEGTACAVVNAMCEQLVLKTCAITPADISFVYDELHAVICAHKRNNADLTWVVMSDAPEDAQNKGKILVNDVGRVCKVLEGTDIQNDADISQRKSLYGFTSAGVVIAEADCLIQSFATMQKERDVPHTKSVDLWRDLIAWLVENDKKVYAYITTQLVNDLGEIDRLSKAGGLSVNYNR